MRKLKIIEHISLDGVLQTTSGPEDDFPYGDWTAPYRSPAGLEIVTEMYGKTFDLLFGRRTYDSVGEFLAESAEESDGGPPECGDEIRRNSQAREAGMGPVRGHWTGPRG